ncbi:hypothetical protein HPB50_021976 [Hyalomma asiaticum]|uniref:Uncharacterized protein n=1 Tax=Hyalomma asiaticum TaxID=266040 RepID=A0ACB7TNU1_HYAAI|nr:hypothetical protein HPB50_021976 [Hyalomma asiaticum]
MPQRRRHKPGAERLSRDARRSRGSGRERHGALGGRQNPSGEARPARALSTLAPPQQHGGRPGDAPGMPRRKQHRPQRMQCDTGQLVYGGKAIERLRRRVAPPRSPAGPSSYDGIVASKSAQVMTPADRFIGPPFWGSEGSFIYHAAAVLGEPVRPARSRKARRLLACRPPGSSSSGLLRYQALASLSGNEIYSLGKILLFMRAGEIGKPQTRDAFLGCLSLMLSHAAGSIGSLLRLPMVSVPPLDRTAAGEYIYILASSTLGASDALMVCTLKSRPNSPFSWQIPAKALDDVISGAHAARPGGCSSSKDRPN